MDRRAFLQSAAGLAIGGSLYSSARNGAWSAGAASCARRMPAASIIPVVGDGKWIWTEPPKETGYLEPRTHEVKIGIEMEGTGPTTRLKAATAVPVACPEQEVEEVQLEARGCDARLRTLANGSVQLVLSAAALGAGQRLFACATFHLKLYKQYHGYERDQFAYVQRPERTIRRDFLQDSPGIQTSAPEVASLAKKLSAGAAHPWDKARIFQEWVAANIRARIGPYTSVVAAIRDGVGDCEERSSVFVALCRAVGIPARLVWVPNHNWAEFYLRDQHGTGHWIPAHTSCYPWFGWTGAHELVMQKGDRLEVPERSGKQLRLFEDWAQWAGPRPHIRWLAEIVPTAKDGDDAGPGKRTKDAKGEWVLTGNHPMDKILRR